MEKLTTTYTTNNQTVIDGVNARDAIRAARKLYGMDGDETLLDPHVAPSSSLKRKKGTVKMSVNGAETDGLIEYATITDDFTAGNFAVAVALFDVAVNDIGIGTVRDGFRANKLDLVEIQPKPGDDAPYFTYRIVGFKTRAKTLKAWIKAESDITGYLVKLGKLAGKTVRHEDEIEAEDETPKAARVSIAEDKIGDGVQKLLEEFGADSIQELIDGLNTGLELVRQAQGEETGTEA